VILVAEGDPIETLVTAADDVDLLVLATRGRSPFAGLLLGSVSQACAAHASCPVVLVKRDSQAASPGLIAEHAQCRSGEDRSRLASRGWSRSVQAR